MLCIHYSQLLSGLTYCGEALRPCHALLLSASLILLSKAEEESGSLSRPQKDEVQGSRPSLKFAEARQQIWRLQLAYSPVTTEIIIAPRRAKGLRPNLPFFLVEKSWPPCNPQSRARKEAGMAYYTLTSSSYPSSALKAR